MWLWQCGFLFLQKWFLPSRVLYRPFVGDFIGRVDIWMNKTVSCECLKLSHGYVAVCYAILSFIVFHNKELWVGMFIFNIALAIWEAFSLGAAFVSCTPLPTLAGGALRSRDWNTGFSRQTRVHRAFPGLSEGTQPKWRSCVAYSALCALGVPDASLQCPLFHSYVSLFFWSSLNPWFCKSWHFFNGSLYLKYAFMSIHLITRKRQK